MCGECFNYSFIINPAWANKRTLSTLALSLAIRIYPRNSLPDLVAAEPTLYHPLTHNQQMSSVTEPALQKSFEKQFGSMKPAETLSKRLEAKFRLVEALAREGSESGVDVMLFKNVSWPRTLPIEAAAGPRRPAE